MTSVANAWRLVPDAQLDERSGLQKDICQRGSGLSARSPSSFVKLVEPCRTKFRYWPRSGQGWHRDLASSDLSQEVTFDLHYDGDRLALT